MPRSRTVVGFGPTFLGVTHTTTGSTGTAWIPFGPFDASKLYAVFTFGTSTARAQGKLQATVDTSLSSDCTKVIVQNLGSATNVYKKSTYTSGVFSYVRFWSTRLATGSTAPMAQAVYFNALP